MSSRGKVVDLETQPSPHVVVGVLLSPCTLAGRLHWHLGCRERAQPPLPWAFLLTWAVTTAEGFLTLAVMLLILQKGSTRKDALKELRFSSPKRRMKTCPTD